MFLLVLAGFACLIAELIFALCRIGNVEHELIERRRKQKVGRDYPFDPKQ